MRIKLTSVLAIALIITACASLAIAKSPLPGKDSKLEAPSTILGSPHSSRDYFEGFEAAVPPAGWTQGITNATNTWQQLDSGPLEGSYSAYIRWDTTVSQDETIEFTQLIDVAGGEYVLSFWMAGSLGQTWDANDVQTVEIDGSTVFDFDSSVTSGYMVYDQYFIDLSGYDTQTVTITFRYAGLDGDATYLDAVMVDGGTGYQVPDVEFCSLATDVYGQAPGGDAYYSGDTCGGLNLVSALGCEAYAEAGLEDYYAVMLNAGQTLTATMTSTADGALWLVEECSAPMGAFTCLAYADDTLTGEAEIINYTNTTGAQAVVYLVVDSWGADSCGTYDLEIQGVVDTEPMSFGQIKHSFR